MGHSCVWIDLSLHCMSMWTESNGLPREVRSATPGFTPINSHMHLDQLHANYKCRECGVSCPVKESLFLNDTLRRLLWWGVAWGTSFDTSDFSRKYSVPKHEIEVQRLISVLMCTNCFSWCMGPPSLWRSKGVKLICICEYSSHCGPLI